MILNTGEVYTPDDADIIAWQKAYQAVDVYQELRAMESWLDANPTRRKTKRGIKRFINKWLGRAQDKGGSPLAQKARSSDSLRAKTVDMQLCDITWLQGDLKETMKQFYLTKHGRYYDGEIKTV